MKKLIFIGLLFSFILFSVNAEGFYVDFGAGIGKATTIIDGIDVTQGYDEDSFDIGVELGLKVGYAPFDFPIYFAGVIGAMGYRITDTNIDSIQFNSYLFGPGVIYYPLPFLQIAASAGYSIAVNKMSPQDDLDKNYKGFAWDVSAAYDFGGSRFYGFMLGARYFWARNILEEMEAAQYSSLISVFARYRFR